MRILTEHKVDGSNSLLNRAIEIEANGEPGPGGAHTIYSLYVPDHPEIQVPISTTLHFQNGPIHETSDFNGISNESVLVVLIDRMRGFQSGPFACRENALALTHMEEALMWLQKRTRDRVARGVEGMLHK